MRRRLITLLLSALAALGLGLFVPQAANAGQIYCGTSPRINFYNQTAPSSQVWVDDPTLCPYNSILTVSGDHVYLDGGGSAGHGTGGYMRLSPRVACDVWVDDSPMVTWRNYSYTDTAEYALGIDYLGHMHWKYRISLCNGF